MLFAQVPEVVSMFTEWWPILLMAGAALGAIYRIFKNGMRNILSDLVETEIKPIQEQFKNNGGSTLKDAVDRMAVGLEQSNQKAEEGLLASSATSERVLSVAAEMAEKVEVTNRRVSEEFEEIRSRTEKNRQEWVGSIQRIDEKLDLTSDKMHEAARHRRVQEEHMVEKLNSIAEKVASSASRINTVTANLPTPYFEVDENVKMKYVNDAFLQLLDLTWQEAMKVDMNEFVAPEDLSRVQRTATTALENRVEWLSSYTLVRRDGKRIKIVVHAHPIWDGEKFGGYTGAYTLVD